jgi:hypothetical protein
LVFYNYEESFFAGIDFGSPAFGIFTVLLVKFSAFSAFSGFLLCLPDYGSTLGKGFFNFPLMGAKKS